MRRVLILVCRRSRDNRVIPLTKLDCEDSALVARPLLGSPLDDLNQFLPQLVISREGQDLRVAVAVSLMLHVLMGSLLFKVV